MFKPNDDLEFSTDSQIFHLAEATFRGYTQFRRARPFVERFPAGSFSVLTEVFDEYRPTVMSHMLLILLGTEDILGSDEKILGVEYIRFLAVALVEYRHRWPSSRVPTASFHIYRTDLGENPARVALGYFRKDTVVTK